ncbi:MAG: phosphotransferase enzyme family protein [Acidimicrobiia bacterium]
MTDDQWSDLGYNDVTELGGGWQSRTFVVRAGDTRLVAKLTRADLVDKHALERKTALVADLARIEPSVVAPARIGGTFVHESEQWLITATSFVDGEHVDQADPSSGTVLGTALAGLHRSMCQLPTAQVPRVATLTTDAAGRWTSTSSDQLLHGDFAASNVVVSPEGIRVFDFDDCGYGPIEFDIANSLYMVMFDTWVQERANSGYQLFREEFLASYAETAEGQVSVSDIDDLIRVRVMALDQWVHDPSEAPIGIRNSSPDWIATLHRFVDEWDRWNDSLDP